jgi:hypothetical protein
MRRQSVAQEARADAAYAAFAVSQYQRNPWTNPAISAFFLAFWGRVG